MKSGTAIGIGFAVIAVVAGAAIYYLQGFAYYSRVDGLSAVSIGGRDFAVTEYQGLDNKSLPLRLRGCFRLADPQAALEAGTPDPEAAPFEAPFWFDCWDVERLARDLRSGAAKAVIAEQETQGDDFRTERIVAIYPDGAAYQWRRIIELK